MFGLLEILDGWFKPLEQNSVFSFFPLTFERAFSCPQLPPAVTSLYLSLMMLK